MKVRIHYRDGQYSADEWKQPGPDFVGEWAGVEMTDADWRAYQAFRALDNYWHDRLRELDNRQYALDNAEQNDGDTGC